jgi:hypothetical protein
VHLISVISSLFLKYSVGVVHTRVTRVGLADDIRGEGADGGDGDVVRLVWGKSRHEGRSGERGRWRGPVRGRRGTKYLARDFSRCYLIARIPTTRSDAVRDATVVTGAQSRGLYVFAVYGRPTSIVSQSCHTLPATPCRPYSGAVPLTSLRNGRQSTLTVARISQPPQAMHQQLTEKRIGSRWFSRHDCILL